MSQYVNDSHTMKIIRKTFIISTIISKFLIFTINGKLNFVNYTLLEMFHPFKSCHYIYVICVG